MAHPAHYFIRFLFLFEDDTSDGAINAKLRGYGIGGLKPEALAEYRQTLPQVPEDFRPWQTSHRPSREWLRGQRVFSLVHPDEATQEMYTGILGNPRLREDVERLLLGNVSPGEVAYRLKKQKKVVSESAVAEYRHYFWNTEVMSVQDWADYFAEDDTRRTRGSRKTLEAVLASGPELALYRTGIEKDLDHKKMMVEVQRELYYTFVEVKGMAASARKVEMLSVLARSMAKIDERIQAGDTAIQAVLKQFEKFRVQTNQGSAPGMFKLAPTGSISSKSPTEILSTKDEEH